MKVYLKRFPKDSLIVQTSGDLQYANSNFRSNNSETLTIVKIIVKCPSLILKNRKKEKKSYRIGYKIGFLV